MTQALLKCNVLDVPISFVTIPPVLFAPYFHIATQFSTWCMSFISAKILPLIVSACKGLAVLRGLLIGAGILAALMMNSLLFPRHCRVNPTSFEPPSSIINSLSGLVSQQCLQLPWAPGSVVYGFEQVLISGRLSFYKTADVMIGTSSTLHMHSRPWKLERL